MTNIQASIELPMRSAILLMGMAVMAQATGLGAATLNKCIDAQGRVTYSNLPCQNARVVRKVDIDPAPQPDPVKSPPAQAQSSAKPSARSSEPPPLEIDRTRVAKTPNGPGNPEKPASARNCAALSEKLGRVFDEMDAARRKGYTLKEMDDWNREVKDLERKKQQSGCF
jgi:hypothetical protein